MNGSLCEAKKKLEEMAMKHNMTQSDCYDGIRHISLIMLSMSRDMMWIKLLMILILGTVFGMQGLRLVI